MPLIAFGSLRNLPNTKLYLPPLHVSPTGGVYRNLQIAALLVTFECCTPKNVWGFIQIHGLKFIKGVWSRMAGKMAALAMCKEENLTILRPVPSNLRNPREGSMRENNLFTATGAGDSTNNHASTLVHIQDGTNWPPRGWSTLTIFFTCQTEYSAMLIIKIVNL
jgi:hypothetical protein